MKKLLITILFLLPLFVFAQSGGQRSLKTKSENIIHTDLIGGNDSTLLRIDSNGVEHSLRLGTPQIYIENDSIKIKEATSSMSGLMSAADKKELTALNAVESLSGTAVTLDVSAKRHGYLTLTGNTTITLTNVNSGNTGNITIVATTSYTVEFSSSYTLDVAPNLEAVAGVITIPASTRARLSYWCDGVYLVINGTFYE